MTLASRRWVDRRIEENQTAGKPRRFDLGGSGGLDLSKVALGYEINPDGDDPDEVEIKAGEIDRIAVAAAKLVVADDGYVYVRRTIATDAMLVATAASVPANDATYRYYRLYRFSVTDGAASIQNIYRPFDIEQGPDIAAYTGSQFQVLQIDSSGTTVIVDWVRAHA